VFQEHKMKMLIATLLISVFRKYIQLVPFSWEWSCFAIQLLY